MTTNLRTSICPAFFPASTLKRGNITTSSLIHAGTVGRTSPVLLGCKHDSSNGVARPVAIDEDYPAWRERDRRSHTKRIRRDPRRRSTSAELAVLKPNLSAGYTFTHVEPQTTAAHVPAIPNFNTDAVKRRVSTPRTHDACLNGAGRRSFARTATEKRRTSTSSAQNTVERERDTSPGRLKRRSPLIETNTHTVGREDSGANANVSTS